MKQTQVNKNINFVHNKQLFVKQIKISYFRNYKNLELNLSSDNVVLFGLNGVGKTNILEAVSYLTSGRGIRKAEDKDYLHVVDITSNLKYSKRHLTKRKAFYKEQGFPFTVTKVEYK